jgi:hypothetical protein
MIAIVRLGDQRYVAVNANASATRFWTSVPEMGGARYEGEAPTEVAKYAWAHSYGVHAWPTRAACVKDALKRTGSAAEDVLGGVYI